MKAALAIMSLIISFKTYTQTWVDVTNEYIQNPSFEEYSACPQGASGFPSVRWIDSCVGWYMPTIGTSDYFNKCSNSNLVTIPNNIPMGYQYPFDGNAFCGFFAYELFGNNELWCEYIQTQLITPLKANTKYLFSMRINRANDYNLSVKNIGAHFSSASMQDYSTTRPYNFVPTILNNTGYINDTLNWTLVAGEYTATGNEQYLTIGWFGDENSDDFFTYFFIPPDFDPVTGDTLYVPMIYYAVDSLKLFELIYDIENFNINVFSPNGDGINDVLDFSVYELKELQFTVYNRWGTLVFNSTNPHLKWDGTNNKSEKLSDGTYYYILNATTQENKLITKHNFLSIFN